MNIYFFSRGVGVALIAALVVVAYVGGSTGRVPMTCVCTISAFVVGTLTRWK